MPAKRGALGSSWCQAALHPPHLPLPWGSHDLPCRLCPRCDLEKFSSFIQIKSAYLGAPRVKEGGRVWSNWGDSRNLPRTLSPRPGGRCPGEKQSAVGWPRPCSGAPTLRGEGPVLTRGTLGRTRGLVSWRGRPRGPCLHGGCRTRGPADGRVYRAPGACCHLHLHGGAAQMAAWDGS